MDIPAAAGLGEGRRTAGAAAVVAAGAEGGNRREWGQGQVRGRAPHQILFTDLIIIINK